MENYFYDSLGRGVSNIAYRYYGGVKISLGTDNASTFVQPVIYDKPSEFINALSVEEQAKHVVFKKEYTLEDVDYNDEITVYKKLHDVIADIEITISGQTNDKGVMENV